MFNYMKIYTVVADVSSDTSSKFQSCLNIAVSKTASIEDLLSKHSYILKENNGNEAIKIDDIISITQILDKVYI